MTYLALGIISAEFAIIIGLLLLLGFWVHQGRKNRQTLSPLERIPIGVIAIDKSGQICRINNWLQSTLNLHTLASVREKLSAEAIKNAIQAPQERLRLNLDRHECQGIIQAVSGHSEITHLIYVLPDAPHIGIPTLQPSVSYLQALRGMALGLAHELKNPITAIKMLLQMFDANNRQEFNTQFKEILSFELERLDKIIGDFLHFADIGVMHPGPVNPNDILEEVETIIHRNYMNRHFKLSKTFFPLPKLLLDKSRMIQVFLNLIINAVEALPAHGGRIELKTRKVDHTVEIDIIDDGHGIREDDQDRIFLPFFTTKKEGVGLGLAITQKIIHEHQGTISFRSTGGKTLFRVILPIPESTPKQDV